MTSWAYLQRTGLAALALIFPNRTGQAAWKALQTNGFAGPVGVSGRS